MSKTLITQAQWEAVTKSKKNKKVKIDLPENPSRFKKGPKRPVENVNWWQAEEFCSRLAIETSHNYRLPSEVQWEYACLSGTTTRFYCGDELSPKVANYGNNVKGTTDVDTYHANTWGLYDMHGNVWEWCADHWRDSREIPFKDSNPYLSSEINANRVARGGCFLSGPLLCGSSSRASNSPSVPGLVILGFVGVRLVCFASST